jgi:hypothetical protein
MSAVAARRRCGRPTVAGGPCRRVLAAGEEACRHHRDDRHVVLHTSSCAARNGWGIPLEVECFGPVQVQHFVCEHCGRHSYWLEVVD